MRNIWIALVALVVLVGCQENYSISIPVSTVHAELAKSFPITQKEDYGTLVVQAPTLVGDGNETLKMQTSFVVSNFLIPKGIEGKVALHSGIRFDATSKQIFLDQPMVDEIAFGNVSLSKLISNDVRQLIGAAIAQSVANKPIYTIREKHAVAAVFIRGIRVSNGNVVVTFGL